jgi:hypothetical protein
MSFAVLPMSFAVLPMSFAVLRIVSGSTLTEIFSSQLQASPKMMSFAMREMSFDVFQNTPMHCCYWAQRGCVSLLL